MVTLGFLGIYNLFHGLLEHEVDQCEALLEYV